MEGENIYRGCEYERIRMKYLAKNLKTLLLCMNKRLSDNEFNAIKEDLLALVEDI